MKVYIYTLGCKVNQYESQALSEDFKAAGYTVSPVPEGCDVFVINSCTVTASGDRKTRQQVRHFKALNPSSCVVLTGCMPQAYKDQAEALTEADIVTGNRSRKMIPAMVSGFFENGKRTVHIEDHLKGDLFESDPISAFDGRTRAFVKIQDGCNRYCSYCIIPTARGRSRSRKISDIKPQLEELDKAGFPEIVFVGINLCCFGLDTGESLIDVLKFADSLENVQRIRLGSLEFDNIDDEFIDGLKGIKKLCPQFHLSLQSGCDKTLKAMNRHYTSSEYESLVLKLRSSFENTSVTTDIMVGFPGETEEDFKESKHFAEKIGFEKVHVFPYSKRPGTKAAEMPQIEKHIKEERAHDMAVLCEKIRNDYLCSQIGKTLSVLCERSHDGYCLGYTENYTPVKIITDENLQGRTVGVTIENVNNDYCQGSCIN